VLESLPFVCDTVPGVQHLRSSARELSARVALELAAVENGVIRYTSSIQSQALDSAFPWNNPTQDFTFQQLPPGSLAPVARLQQEQRSLQFSTHYLPADQTVTAGTNRSVATSLAMQHMYLDIWNAHPSAVAMYTGYENSVFRIFPGQDPASLIPGYNPVERGWYRSAKNQEVGVIHTDPYVDAFGLGWLITVAQTVQDNSGSGQSVAGVTGVDLTIDTLQASILEVGFFSEKSSASMVQVNGRVVADPSWDAAAQAQAAYNVQGANRLAAINGAQAPHISDIHPGLSRSLWAQLSDPSGGIKTFSYQSRGETYVLARSFIPVHPLDDPSIPDNEKSALASSFQPRYVVFVEAKQKDIHVTLDEMAKRIETSTAELIGIAAAVCFVTLVAVLLVVLCMSHVVTQPLKGMMKVATSITASQNIGVASGDIRSQTSEIAETNDEIGQFASHFKRMVNGLDSKEVTRTKASKATRNKLAMQAATCEQQQEIETNPQLPWTDAFNNLGIGGRN